MCVIYIHSSATYSCKSTHHTIRFGKQTGFHPLVVKHSKGTLPFWSFFWLGNRDIIQTWRTFSVRLDGLKTYQHMSKCIAGTTRQQKWATSMMCSQCSNGWDILTQCYTPYISLSCPKIPHSAWLQYAPITLRTVATIQFDWISHDCLSNWISGTSSPACELVTSNNIPKEVCVLISYQYL